MALVRQELLPFAARNGIEATAPVNSLPARIPDRAGLEFLLDSTLDWTNPTNWITVTVAVSPDNQTWFPVVQFVIQGPHRVGGVPEWAFRWYRHRDVVRDLHTFDGGKRVRITVSTNGTKSWGLNLLYDDAVRAGHP